MTAENITENGTFGEFAGNEDPRNSVTVIFHACVNCGKTFRAPVIVTAIENFGDEDLTDADIPNVVCSDNCE